MRCVHVAVQTHELGRGGAGRFPAVTGVGGGPRGGGEGRGAPLRGGAGVGPPPRGRGGAGGVRGPGPGGGRGGAPPATPPRRCRPAVGPRLARGAETGTTLTASLPCPP